MTTEEERLILQRLLEAVHPNATRADGFIEVMRAGAVFALGTVQGSDAQRAATVKDAIEYYARWQRERGRHTDGLSCSEFGETRGNPTACRKLPAWDAPVTQALRGRLTSLLRAHLDLTPPIGTQRDAPPTAGLRTFDLRSGIQDLASSRAPGPGGMSGPAPGHGAGFTMVPHPPAFFGGATVDALYELEALRRRENQERIEHALAMAERQAEPMRILREIHHDLRVARERARERQETSPTDAGHATPDARPVAGQAAPRDPSIAQAAANQARPLGNGGPAKALDAVCNAVLLSKPADSPLLGGDRTTHKAVLRPLFGTARKKAADYLAPSGRLCTGGWIQRDGQDVVLTAGGAREGSARIERARQKKK